MTGNQDNTNRDNELSPLTDSLTSCIRWRLSDYESMLRGEVELLLDGRAVAERRTSRLEQRPR